MFRSAILLLMLSVGSCLLVGCKKSVAVSTGASTSQTVPDEKDGGKSEVVRSTAEDLPVEVSKPKNTAQLISFDDLKIGMPEDTKFRPVMLTYNDGKVKELFGKRVIVSGYMNPTDTMKGVTDFILLRNLDCKFGPGGQADHLVRVYLQDGDTTSFTDKVVYVEGELSLNPFPEDPFEPMTYSIYDMNDAKVSTRRPAGTR